MRCKTLALLALLLAAPQPASAHPHAWIYLETQPVFNASGHITGLRQRWTFDQYYTEFILQDLKVQDRSNPPQDVLMQLARTNLSNLKPYGYFTRLMQGGKELAQGTAGEVESKVEKGALVMDFTLPLAQPANPRDGALTYRIFDPTYYVEMLHHSKKRIRLPQNVPTGCTLSLTEPNPTLEQVSLASALDKNAQAPENLGALFAETITLACP
jgi:ABC-type uncharacterized transport system substrate-binding protein